ncbi:DUF6337 family protein [Caldithrix abyssi]
MKSEIFLIQLTTVGNILFLSLLMVAETRRLNNLITPFNVAAAPFIFIFLLSNFVLIHFDFPPVTIRSQLFIVGCLLVMWSVGLVLSRVINTERLEPAPVYFKFAEEFYKFDFFLIVLAWIVSLITIRKMMSLFHQHGGFAFFGSEDYEKEMIVGLVAHLVQIGKVVFILLVFIYRRVRFKKLTFLTLLVLGLAIASVQVKYHIMFVIFIAFLFYNVEKPVKQQLKVLAGAALTLFLIMNVFWLSLTLAWGTFDVFRKDIWEFFLKQTLNYFVTGPMVLDTWLQHPAVKPDWTMLIVFFNFLFFVTGNYLRYNVVPLVNLGFQQTAPDLYSNVGTAFGVYYLIGGIPFTLFAVLVFSAVSYFLYYKSLTKYAPYLIFFNLLFLTMGLLSFFVQYFTLLSTYQNSVIFVLLVAGFKFINFLNRNINS